MGKGIIMQCEICGNKLRYMGKLNKHYYFHCDNCNNGWSTTNFKSLTPEQKEAIKEDVTWTGK